jgi:hypothetical protein
MGISLKYVAVSVAIQFIACASLWLAAEVHSWDAPLELIIYFYWPILVFMVVFLRSLGQPTMIGAPIGAIPLGMITYGIILGAVISLLKKKRV